MTNCTPGTSARWDGGCGFVKYIPSPRSDLATAVVKSIFAPTTDMPTGLADEARYRAEPRVSKNLDPSLCPDQRRDAALLRGRTSSSAPLRGCCPPLRLRSGGVVEHQTLLSGGDDGSRTARGVIAWPPNRCTKTNLARGMPGEVIAPWRGGSARRTCLGMRLAPPVCVWKTLRRLGAGLGAPHGPARAHVRAAAVAVSPRLRERESLVGVHVGTRERQKLESPWLAGWAGLGGDADWPAERIPAGSAFVVVDRVSRSLPIARQGCPEGGAAPLELGLCSRRRTVQASRVAERRFQRQTCRPTTKKYVCTGLLHGPQP